MVNGSLSAHGLRVCYLDSENRQGRQEVNKSVLYMGGAWIQCPISFPANHASNLCLHQSQIELLAYHIKISSVYILIFSC